MLCTWAASSLWLILPFSHTINLHYLAGLFCYCQHPQVCVSKFSTPFLARNKLDRNMFPIHFLYNVVFRRHLQASISLRTVVPCANMGRDRSLSSEEHVVIEALANEGLSEPIVDDDLVRPTLAILLFPFSVFPSYRSSFFLSSSQLDTCTFQFCFCTGIVMHGLF